MRECETCKRCFTNETLLCPQDGAQTTASLLGEPTLDGRYQLERRLGKGSMGIVFEARHIFLKTSSAIKVILPDLVGNDPMLVTRFREQALRAARLRHKNIIAVMDFGALGGTMPFLVMELLHGKSLREILAEEKVMSPRRALEFIEAIAAGLGAAHRQNIWHHDLKPSNIMVQDEMPIAEGLKILDFGLARIRSIEQLLALSRQGHAMYSAWYMAPEQWTNQAPDARADIYSLGIILYQMLSGTTPFRGSARFIMQKHLEETPFTPGVEMPQQIEHVVWGALVKDVSARTQSVEAFLAELREAVGLAEVSPKASRADRGSEIDEIGFVGSSGASGALLRPGLSDDSPDLTVDRMTAHRETSAAGSSQQREEIRGTDPHHNDLSASSSQAAPPTKTPIYLDENVQFTVYKPKKIRPQKWYALLAYAHLSERRPDEDEDDPIERMETEVKRILGEQKLASYSRATEDSSQAVPRRGEITFVPFVDGIEFNPPSQSFLWQESVHGQEFRMLASAALDGKTARGQVSVFLGSILLAEINVSLRVDSTQVLTDEQVPLEKETPARPYRNVFASYSHKDIEIVAQIEHYAQISGDKYLRDVFELRSGQNWKQWMRKAIETADIFQLFWSTNSMHSENVRLEWQYALRLGRPNFIRPTYWESPLPQSPADNLPPPELLDLHFQQVRSPLSLSVASPKQDDVAGAEDRNSLTGADAPLEPPGDSPAESRSETLSPRVASIAVEGKLCPTCHHWFADEFDFCIADGARLMSARPPLRTARALALTQTGAASVVSPAWAPPTVVAPPATALPFPIWIGLLAIVFAIVGLIVGLLILLLVTRK